MSRDSRAYNSKPYRGFKEPEHLRTGGCSVNHLVSPCYCCPAQPPNRTSARNPLRLYPFLSGGFASPRMKYRVSWRISSQRAPLPCPLPTLFPAALGDLNALRVPFGYRWGNDSLKGQDRGDPGSVYPSGRSKVHLRSKSPWCLDISIWRGLSRLHLDAQSTRDKTRALTSPAQSRCHLSNDVGGICL